MSRNANGRTSVTGRIGPSGSTRTPPSSTAGMPRTGESPLPLSRHGWWRPPLLAIPIWCRNSRGAALCSGRHACRVYHQRLMKIEVVGQWLLSGLASEGTLHRGPRPSCLAVLGPFLWRSFRGLRFASFFPEVRDVHCAILVSQTSSSTEDAPAWRIDKACRAPNWHRIGCLWILRQMQRRCLIETLS